MTTIKVKPVNGIFKTSLAVAMAVVCLAGGVAAQDFFTETFETGTPTGWTYNGFSRLSSGGLSGQGACLRANLHSGNTTASVTIPNVNLGTNAELSYSYIARNYSDGSSAASGVMTHNVTVSASVGVHERSQVNYQTPTGYWTYSWPLYYLDGNNVIYSYGMSSVTITFTWKSGDIYVFLDNIVLVGARYAIKYDANGGTVSKTADTTKTETRTLASLPTPTRDRYAFNGWFTSATGGTKVTTTTAFNSNTTIYAQWIPIYKVTFDATGGSVSPTYGSTGTGGMLTTLPTPTRSGYTFNGWFTAETGGTEVTTSTEFSSDATIYARWTQNPYTVTFNANGGSVSPTSGTVNASGMLSSLPTPTRSGYTFDGWFTAATGGTEVTESKVYSANTTIYAQWTLITYTITFNANDGTVSPASGTTGTGGRLTSLPTPTRDGYTFNGWFTAEEGGTQVTTSTVFSGDATIYAQWTLITYIITFNANSGTVSPTSGTTGIGGKLTSLPTPTRSGYTFDGWFTAATGGTQVTTSRVYSANTTIYAQWTLITYTIMFDANGGTVTTEFGTTGTGYKLSSLPTPTRDGYIFDGWFTAEEGGTQVTTNTVFNEDATIYAQWTLSEIPTVTFDANGGSVSPTYGVIGTNGRLASLPEPTARAGYTFNGWFTALTGGTQVTTSTVFSGSTTIYARWTVNTYAIAFSAGANGTLTATVDGSSIATGASVQYGKSVVFTAVPATGYKVSGWTVNGTAVTGNTTTSYTITSVSAASTVAVSFVSANSVSSGDRVIPQSGPSEVVVIAPITAPASGFTAGPSPVSKSGDGITFYASKAVKGGTLYVYDESGNAVAKIAVKSGVGGKSIGAWNLRDKRGVAVADGSYVVRGVLVGKDGKSEKVSFVFSVVK